jgi:hypothetical protein
MENENEKAESSVTGFGNPSLDADPIDESTEAHIDSLLDDALSGVEPVFADEPVETETVEEVEEIIPETSDAPESTETTEATDAPEAPVTPEVELDPEIASIEQPRNLSEVNRSNWRKLQETASTYKKQAEEAEQLRQRVAEMESRQQEYKAPDDYEELKKFRAIFDIKNDPEFQSKYNQPIQSAKENIYNILRKNGASEDVIQSIEKAGGPDAVDQSWWKHNAIDKLPLTDSERLKRNLVDVVDLKEKQEKEIENAAQNAEQIIAQREQEKGQWYQQEVQQIDKHIDEITKELPWARFVEAPKDATPEKLEQVQRHNAQVQSLAEKFNSALWPTNAQERANVAAAAVFSHVLTEQLRVEQEAKTKYMTELKSLREENNKLKGAGKVPRQTITGQHSIKSSLNDRLKMNSMDAIDLGLDEALGN